MRQRNCNNRLRKNGKSETFGTQEEGEELRGHNPDHGVEKDSVHRRVQKDHGNGTTRAILILRIFRAILRTQGHADSNHNTQEHGANPECSDTRPTVCHNRQVDNLANDSHHAVDTADKKRRFTGKADGLVEYALEVLYNLRAAELAHGYDERRGGGSAEVLFRKHLLEGEGPGSASLATLKAKLLSDLDEFLTSKTLVFDAMEFVKDCGELRISVLL